MGSLGVELQAAAAPPVRNHCSVRVILLSLDPDDRASLELVLASPMMSNSIARVLTDKGHFVRGHTIARHRREQCSCVWVR